MWAAHWQLVKQSVHSSSWGSEAVDPAVLEGAAPLPRRLAFCYSLSA
jgi:hypothetical protein